MMDRERLQEALAAHKAAVVKLVELKEERQRVLVEHEDDAAVERIDKQITDEERKAATSKARIDALKAEGQKRSRAAREEECAAASADIANVWRRGQRRRWR
jgi:hypothetical protein